MSRGMKSIDLPRFHATLATDWRDHEEQIKSNWMSFSQKERVECFQATQLAHDSPLENMENLMGEMLTPEWSVEEIAAEDSQYFLDMLESRATRDLYQQTFHTFKGFKPDSQHINELIKKSGCEFPHKLADERMFFVGQKKDGATADIASQTAFLRNLAQRADHDVAIRVLPLKVGELVHQRQRKFLLNMYLMVCEILEREPLDIHQIQRLGRSKGTSASSSSLQTPDAAANLNGQTPIAKVLLPGLINRTLNYICVTEEYNALYLQPENFAIYVLRYITNRPEQLRDAKGQRLYNTYSKSVGTAFFDSMNEKQRAIVTWQYIIELLCLLHFNFDNKPFRHSVLQQLANVCQMEYDHVQDMIRIEIQTGIARGCFTRIDKIHKKGNPLTVMKDQPEKLAAPNSVLHCFLKLSQRGTTSEDAIGLVNTVSIQLEDGELEKLSTGERQVACYMAQLTAFILDLSLLFRMPSFSRTKPVQFLTRLQQAQAQMIPVKSLLQIDKLWRNFLKHPDKSRINAAYAALDTCTRLCVGKTIEETYKDVVNGCLQEILMARSTPKSTTKNNTKTEPSRSCTAKPPPQPEQAEVPETWRALEAAAAHDSSSSSSSLATKNSKKKIKTRGKPQAPEQAPPAPLAKPAQVMANGKIKVSASAAHVFSILFDRSLARGGLRWTKFESAMAEIGFSITYTQGSNVRFEPPPGLGLSQSLSVHRCHGTHQDGFRTLHLSKRLTNAFGWNNETFVVR
ncbi:hypothetical protein PWT90_08389 [Aphanocladium album]|nr:hypothetical protein PWT90_08389 [Aphanocladium album]